MLQIGKMLDPGTKHSRGEVTRETAILKYDISGVDGGAGGQSCLSEKSIF